MDLNDKNIKKWFLEHEILVKTISIITIIILFFLVTNSIHNYFYPSEPVSFVETIEGLSYAFCYKFLLIMIAIGYVLHG